MIDAEKLIERMMTFYGVKTISELANIIHISQPSISAWKKNNYIDAIEKRCKELGIYEEIFKGIDTKELKIKIKQGKKSRAAGRDFYETKTTDCEFEELTIALIKKLVTKFGNEDTLQKKLMELL